MSYTITDRVETGYSHGTCVGGTVRVQLEFEQYVSDTSEYSKLVDLLDHCFVTANKDAIRFSKRIFVLDKVTNFYEDIASIVIQLIDKNQLARPVSISVIYGENVLKTAPVITSTIVYSSTED
jgi:hypothetical protein